VQNMIQFVVKRQEAEDSRDCLVVARVRHALDACFAGVAYPHVT
jgi:hypothetical protein